jgi:hypothetical protein
VACWSLRVTETVYTVSRQSPLARCGIVLFLVSALLLVGCVRAQVSEAFIEPSTEWRSEDWAATTLLFGPDIEIGIRASNINSPYTKKKDADYFGISLWFDSKGQDFKFDPADVLLFLPGLASLKPSQIKIEFAGLSPKTVGWKCGNHPKVDLGPGPMYALRRGFCVELYFDTETPSPATQFSMHIEGLTRDGRRIVVPTIYFRNGSFWIVG